MKGLASSTWRCLRPKNYFLNDAPKQAVILGRGVFNQCIMASLKPPITPDTPPVCGVVTNNLPTKFLFYRGLPIPLLPVKYWQISKHENRISKAF